MSNPAHPLTRGSSLSLLIPVYNEAENIALLVNEIEEYVPQPYTAYVIFDSEDDNTVPVVKQLAKSRPWLQLLRNRYGRGVAQAIRTGFEVADSGAALVIMADLSDDLSIVPEMLALYEDGHRIVCPSRYMSDGQQIGGPLPKRLLSRIAGLTLYHLAGFPVHDATNNYRLYDVDLVLELGIESTEGFEVALELTAKAHRSGADVAELPTVWRNRTRGSSRFKMWKWLPAYLRWYVYALRS